MEAIGWATMHEIEPRIYEEDGIAIGPAFVGKGFGKQILNALCDEASRCGAREFRSGHRMKNIASAKLLESCGFKYDYDSEEKTDPRTGEKYIIRNLKKEFCFT